MAFFRARGNTAKASFLARPFDYNRTRKSGCFIPKCDDKDGFETLDGFLTIPATDPFEIEARTDASVGKVPSKYR